MKSYHFLGHTADVRLKIEADTPQELFEAAIEAMANLMKKGFCRRKGARIFEEEISVSSQNMTALLIDFMAEVLARSEILHVIFYRVEFSDFTEMSLKAKIFGEKVAVWDKDVKAVTYHEADIKRDKKGNYSTTIIFDI